MAVMSFPHRRVGAAHPARRGTARGSVAVPVLLAAMATPVFDLLSLVQPTAALPGVAAAGCWIGGALLFAASILLLIVACTNVSNLFVVRSAARRAEFAMQLAMGASSGRLARQLLAETLVVCLAAAGLGVLVAMTAGPAHAQRGGYLAARLFHPQEFLQARIGQPDVARIRRTFAAQVGTAVDAEPCVAGG